MSDKPHVSPLKQTDEISVREWAHEYLVAYLTTTSAALSSPIEEEEAHRMIEDQDLVSALWHDVVHADFGDNEFVGVLRLGIAPIGLVLVTERLDPYLRWRTGDVRWIFVEGRHRRKGFSAELLASAEAWMRRRGLSFAETSVGASLEKARAVYEKSGFVPMGLRLGRRLETA